MKEHGVIRRRLSGKEADPYIGQARKILGEMKSVMRLGNIKQLQWTKELQNGVRIMVSSIFGQDEVNIFVPNIVMPQLLPVLDRKIIELENVFIVGSSKNKDGIAHAFRWTEQEGMIDLGALNAASVGYASEATAVSEDGSVVVGFSKAGANNAYHAFIWNKKDGMVDLGTLGTESYAYGVSADGKIVVGMTTISTVAPYYFRPFRWTKETGMVSLGVMSPVLFWTDSFGEEQMRDAYAYGISADGKTIVGESRNWNDDYFAYRWTAETGMVYIGVTGGNSSTAYAANADGTVSGGKTANTSVNEHVAVLFDSAAGVIPLGMQTYSYVTGINSKGNVAVGTVDPNGFRWSEESGVEILSFPSLYTHVSGVSQNGQIVVGYTSTDGGIYSAFQWTASKGRVELGDLGGGWSIANAVTISELKIEQ